MQTCLNHMKKLTFLFLVLAISCTEDEPVPIHPELQKYVDRFYEEAEKRGHILHNDLEVGFTNSLDGYCGFGYWDLPTSPRSRVEIQGSDNCWYDRPDIEKENLMFHELGHALLKKNHNSKRFEGGYSASIMCTQNDVNNCNNFQTYYSEDTREYYLDELFNSSTEEPEWVNNSKNIRNLLVDSMSVLSHWESYNLANDTSNYTYYLDSSTFKSKSIAIERKSNGNSEKVLCGIVQRFEIEDFQNCSSIKARATIHSNHGFDGYATLGISLREEVEGGLNRFMLHEIKEKQFTPTNDFDEIVGKTIETEVFCIPEKTSIVTISVNFISSNAAVIYIDQVEADLWD